tara:strand:+ start:396 stop:800 length:405 start_codon:yes stop_codon:yes gene_type:complete
MISKIKTIKLKKINEKNGSLVAIEFKKNKLLLPRRIFQVYSGANKIRGKHAHKKSSQLLICNYGEIEVISTDGKNKVSNTLKKTNIGLLIPPMIWSELIYKKKKSILTVVTDSYFSEKDYIRNFKEFILKSKAK